MSILADTTLYPTADALVSEANPDISYGDYTLLVARSDSDGNTRSFLKFDLSGLPSGATITLAKLRLNCYQILGTPSSPDTDVQARRVADDSWAEETITWNNQKAHGDVEDTEVPAVAVMEWIVTAYATAEFAGDQTISFCLRMVTEDYSAAGVQTSFRSKEYNGDDPELYIEYSTIVEHEMEISETLGMVDGISSQAALKFSVAETLGLTDAISIKGNFVLAIAEKLGMVDALSRSANFVLSISETLGLLDEISKKADFYLAISETLGLSDGMSTVFDAYMSFSETLGLKDDVSMSAALVVTLEEKLGMKDSISSSAAFKQVFTEKLGMLDLIELNKLINRFQIEGRNFRETKFGGT